MFKKILLLLCMVLTMAGASSVFAGETVLPEPGVYHRVNNNGVSTGLLYVFAGPEGKRFFEVQAYEYNSANKSMIPAYEIKGVPCVFYAGMMEAADGKTLAHLDFGSPDARNGLEQWRFPVIAGLHNGKPARLDYQVETKENAVVLSPVSDVFVTANVINRVEAAGRYIREYRKQLAVNPCLAAYVAEWSDPALRRVAMTRSDVARWDIAKVAAGKAEGIGTVPASWQLKAYDGTKRLIGTYLVAEDLSAVYCNNEKVF